jgi:hypothetical protein
MYSQALNAPLRRLASPRRLRTVSLALVLLLLSGATGWAVAKVASNKQPLSFGQGQTIIDLHNVIWEPLKGEGIPSART